MKLGDGVHKAEHIIEKCLERLRLAGNVIITITIITIIIITTTIIIIIIFFF